MNQTKFFANLFCFLLHETEAPRDYVVVIMNDKCFGKFLMEFGKMNETGIVATIH